MPPDADQIILNFSPTSLTFLNVILLFLMFGVALEIRIADFRNIIAFPRAVFVGLLNQYLVFPAFTFSLVWFWQPQPSLALGLMLVAACPGGNLSNYLTSFGKGNTALSVSMTAVSTVASMVATPALFAFWSSLYPPAKHLMREIHLDPFGMIGSIVLILGLPMAAGMWVGAKFPTFTAKIVQPIRKISLLIFVLFLGGALASNAINFFTIIGSIFLMVALHNGAALVLGYYFSKAAKLPEPDRRAMAIEIAIHNTGLGMALVFTFFNGLGGMAVVAGWWGIWDLIVGLSLAAWWRYKSKQPLFGDLIDAKQTGG